MRINKFVAISTGISRRSADKAIIQKRVLINDKLANVGDEVNADDRVILDNIVIQQKPIVTLILNKPVGFVCSRNGQGSSTIYDLLPKKYHHLKPAGRLDKDSSGLLIMTNDGELANRLTHPTHHKIKQYEVKLDHKLSQKDTEKITISGVILSDGLSKFNLNKMKSEDNKWLVTMAEGRNRQIRRTFEALGNHVISLHRIKIGDYKLKKTKSGSYRLTD